MCSAQIQKLRHTEFAGTPPFGTMTASERARCPASCSEWQNQAFPLATKAINVVGSDCRATFLPDLLDTCGDSSLTQSRLFPDRISSVCTPRSSRVPRKVEPLCICCTASTAARTNSGLSPRRGSRPAPPSWSVTSAAHVL